MENIKFEISKLEESIEYKQDEINDKQQEIDTFEIDSSDCERLYDDMLDECYPELFNMLPSRILSELDPIAYNCGLTDYVDGLEVSEDSDYQELESELEELNSELETLEEELNEIQ